MMKTTIRNIIFVLLALQTNWAKGENTDTTKLSLLFMGDIMAHDTQLAAAWNDSSKSYNYDDCFQFIKPYIQKADLAIANLETPLAGPPYSGYPQFCAPDALADAIKNSGIDILVTANNHACDKGSAGIERTIHVLDSLELPHTGTFRDSADFSKNHPLIIEKNGITIAMLNYTYGTNNIAVPAGRIVNFLDEARILNDVEAAKNLRPDIIIAFLHWGKEYQTEPDTAQTNLALKLKTAGVNLVIGSHPHVLQPMEFCHQSGQLTIYSLGNFLSGQRTAPRDGTAIVEVNIVKTDSVASVSNAGYMLTWVSTPLINNKRRFIIIPVNEAENGLIKTPYLQNRARMNAFAIEARSILKANTSVNELIPVSH